MLIGEKRTERSGSTYEASLDASRLKTARTDRATTSSWLSLVLIMGVYVAMILLTRPLSFGDTVFYVQAILSFGQHSDAAALRSLLDFGHLLWRPFGWFLFETVRALPSIGLLGEDRILVTKILICISMLSGAIATVMLQLICRDLAFRPAVSLLVCATFIFGNSVIYAANAGLSYMLGLAFLMGALWLAMRRSPPRGEAAYPGLWCAGLLLVLSAASWFPFILAAPAVAVAAAIPWDELELFSIHRLSLVKAGHLIIASVVGAVMIFGTATLVLQINSAAAIRTWVSASAHGWRQSSNFLRLGMGLPRCCVALKDDAGVVWKRFLFHDPYAPVRPQNLLQSSLVLMAVFYFGLLLLIYTLARSNKGRVFLILLTIAALPVLYFAVFLLEPSSIERFMPVFPFYFIALGYQLDSTWPNLKQRNLALIYPAVLILFSLAIYNNRSVERHWEPARVRLEALKQQLPTGSTVALLGNWDEVLLFAKDNPLHDTFSQSLDLWVVLVPANERIFIWRELFAARVLEAWRGSREMWVSERLLAESPLPDWGWVEGDDRAIRWIQVPEFCRQFQYDKKIGSPDGFVRLAATEMNRALLERMSTHAKNPAGSAQ